MNTNDEANSNPAARTIAASATQGRMPVFSPAAERAADRVAQPGGLHPRFSGDNLAVPADDISAVRRAAVGLPHLVIGDSGS